MSNLDSEYEKEISNSRRTHALDQRNLLKHDHMYLCYLLHSVKITREKKCMLIILANKKKLIVKKTTQLFTDASLVHAKNTQALSIATFI